MVSLGGVRSSRQVFFFFYHIREVLIRLAALMEYHVMKQLSVAIRIFNLAYNQFSGEIEFVIGFLEFLLSVNDEISEITLSFFKF